MDDEKRAYYEMRAEAELELAQQAATPGACKAHYTLAGMYLNLVHGWPPVPDRHSMAEAAE